MVFCDGVAAASAAVCRRAARVTDSAAARYAHVWCCARLAAMLQVKQSRRRQVSTSLCACMPLPAGRMSAIPGYRHQRRRSNAHSDRRHALTARRCASGTSSLLSESASLLLPSDSQSGLSRLGVRDGALARGLLLPAPLLLFLAAGCLAAPEAAVARHGIAGARCVRMCGGGQGREAA